MSSLPQRVVLTYDDYRKLPDDGRRYEILDGEIHVTPAPATLHQRISRNLEFILHTYVEQFGLGEVLDAPVDVILGRTIVVQPDLVFVGRDRLDMISERGIEGPPDLIVEILSPSTEDIDLGAKHQLYALHGVQHYWVVDPKARTLSEYAVRRATFKLIATHVFPRRIETALFLGLSIDLARVFPAGSMPPTKRVRSRSPNRTRKGTGRTRS